MLHTSIGEVGLNGGGEKSLQLFSGTHKVASLAHTCDAQRQDALLHGVIQLKPLAELGKDLCSHCWGSRDVRSRLRTI
jgi:hypothetical protein